MDNKYKRDTESRGSRITSWSALALALVLLTAGYAWGTFFPAPFDAYAAAIVAVTGAYFTKRLIQKSGRYSAQSGSLDDEPKENIGD